MKKLVAISSAALLAALLVTLQGIGAGAQQGGPPQGQPRGGGGRGPGIEALAPDDHTGFESIFDGKSLKGWDGDPAFWRVENETLIGESTTEKPVKVNTFLIWRGGQPKDFELKLEYRINSTNSGVQYRSVELPEVGKWVMKGYQADIDFQNTYTGQLYEERGRGFLAMRGQFSYIGEGKKAAVVGSVGDSEELKKLIKGDDWNDLHLIARGNTIIQLLNGRITSMVIDDDTAGRKLDGLIGIQCHKGPPMKIEARNIRLKKL